MNIWNTIKTTFTNGLSLDTIPRRLTFVLLDAGALLIAFSLALMLHGELSLLTRLVYAWTLFIIVVAVKIPIFSLFGIYRISLSFLSFGDIVRIFSAVTVSSFIFSGIFIGLSASGTQDPNIPIVISDYLFTIVLIGMLRMATMLYVQVSNRSRHVSRRRVSNLKKTLIAGAGNAGELTLRTIINEKNSDCIPVAIVDDDPVKQGTTIHGVPVLGTCNDIPRLVRELCIDELLIAMPSVSPAIIKNIVALGHEAKLTKIKILPALYDYINGKVSPSNLREIKVEDLLEREPVTIDTGEINRYIKDSVVIVTGGAGSIGSELCRQIASFNPHELVVLDQDETGLFYLKRDMTNLYPNLKLSFVVGDIQNKSRIQNTFLQFKPKIVFHAAAYKHVAMMEENPAEALRNNSIGTKIVAEAACRCKAEKFVLISTDKAVNPTCMMGATKRLAELIVSSFNKYNSCSFMAVRFGNVLGSRGSVVPIFQEQIQKGGPVTVTHPDMKRYFMTPSEAAILVLQAGALGKGGEIFVLDMGNPVSILDMAKEMIRLAGLEPDKDIPIVITNPSPGEKLFEDILTAEEGTLATKHERIYIAKPMSVHTEEYIDNSLQQLEELVNQGNLKTVIKILNDLVPNYSCNDAIFHRDISSSTSENVNTHVSDYIN